MLQPLPIDEAIPALRHALTHARACVLEAPPGAGKTTRAPLALLGEAWMEGKKILMLEPRRVAARAAASRMSSEIGQPLGGTVGYRVRMDSMVGPSTRIEVLTEGLLTRRLQSDSGLSGVGLLIFDEFHERSLHADLGLALAREVQDVLNEDLRILVMSATLDGARVSALLGGAPVVRSEGRIFPVETIYAPSAKPPAQAMADAVRRAIRETEGGILAFLPGEGEIGRTLRELEPLRQDPLISIRPLYGALTSADQDAAIRAAPAGVRKIVLATAIAETSLTIEDVRVVIDSGLQRLPQYDPASGFSRLVTQPVSLASADQRRGRAGRVSSGTCYRLWEEPRTRSLRAYTPPEILTSDLAPFALSLAQWGVGDPAGLALLDQPPQAVFTEARALLTGLDAINSSGRLTSHGREMAGFGAHPRLAHMMIRASERGEGATAAAAAAVLNERDVLRLGPGIHDVDLRTRLDLFATAGGDARADRGALARAREQAKQWRRQLGADEAVNVEAAGRMIALAFPERVAQGRGKGGFKMVSGRGAALDAADALSKEPYLAVAALDGGDANAKVHMAAPLAAQDIEDIFAAQVIEIESVAWDQMEKAVSARAERRLGAIALKSHTLQNVPPVRTGAALLDGVRQMGLGSLPWPDEAQSLRARTAFAASIEPDADWPDMSEQRLLETIERWLEPFLIGITRASQFPRIDTLEALKALLPWDKAKRLDMLAPPALTVPSGSVIRIDYSQDGPVMAVRLQEVFGLTETPRVGGGKVPVLLHLLSPARRPVQVTKDLKSFWANGYPEVKKDLKGRYPKHFWPDDPWTAQATARAKPRGT
jgi:ATP-dependent helicase HrpB